MARSIALIAFLSLLAAVPTQAATSAQRAAAAALVTYERSHFGNTDVENPSCYVLQVWAQCSFGTGHGNAEVNAWLRFKNGKWVFLGSGGGVTTASMLESQYGIPADVARQFQAKQ
ncbi:MAG TPA: hypothetical protein VIN40_01235 [Candidatus Tyrphobacter sp.]